MSNQDVGVVIALISLAVALTGAVMSRRALRRSSYRTSADLVLEADRIFLDRPELRCFFYEGLECPPKGDKQYGQVKAAAEFYLDILETIWDHRGEFARTDRMAWREWIHDLLEWSPSIRDTYLESPRLYPTIRFLIEWEPCAFPEEHEWVAVRPGPTGSGPAFTLKRFLRSAPMIGGYINR